MIKCTAKKEGYAETVCKAMTKACEHHPTKRSKGVFVRNLINIDTGEERGLGILIKSGEYREKGIYVNFCPFCGGKLNTLCE